MKRRWDSVRSRIEVALFPAAAIVIIGSTLLETFTGYTVEKDAASAATVLLIYVAYIFLGAGEKANK